MATSEKVELYIYDLSRGMAAALSPALIGKRIDGIWHTSIVVFGREFFFGSSGVESCTPGGTILNKPLKTQILGETQVPYEVFIDYLNDLSNSSFSGSSYNLFHHNCNNFSEEVAQFLCGASIPKYILDLPDEVLNTKLAPTILALASQLERSARPIAQESTRTHRESSPDLDQLTSQIEEIRYNSFLLEQRRKTLREKLARKEKKREKKRRRLSQQSEDNISLEQEDSNMADTETMNGNGQQLPSEQVLAMEEEEKREEEERKKLREPPIVYKDLIDVKVEFDALLEKIDGKLSPDEERCMEELHHYMLEDEGSWALGDGFLGFIGRLLTDPEFPVEVRVKAVNILAMAALKDDVILLLHQDRKEHFLMNYTFEIDRLTQPEQEAIALFVVNMFENVSSSEWLLYISEWTYKNQQISNIRVTTKVAVHCLLSDVVVLQEKGAAIIHNLACKEVKTVVFDDVAVELTMALLQYFNSKPSEEQLYRCMKALSRFTEISGQEVPQLIQMIGPDPRTFKGASERVDQLIDKVSAKLR